MTARLVQADVKRFFYVKDLGKVIVKVIHSQNPILKTTELKLQYEDQRQFKKSNMKFQDLKIHY